MRCAIILALVSMTCLFAQQTEPKETPPAATSHATPPAAASQKVGKLKWTTDFEQAKAQADKDHKPMLLFFTGSDWCGWCKKMDKEVFESSAFAQEVGNKFVFVMLDFPMNSKLPEGEQRQNAQLKQRYGVTGYPTVVIVDSKGGFIGETGYRSGGGKAYAQWLEQFLSS